MRILKYRTEYYDIKLYTNVYKIKHLINIIGNYLKATTVLYLASAKLYINSAGRNVQPKGNLYLNIFTSSSQKKFVNGCSKSKFISKSKLVFQF